MIDANDLRLFKAHEFKLDGYFYIKRDDGSFEMCVCHEKEEWSKWDEERRQGFRNRIKKLSEGNRLYVRINKPWNNFIV